MYSEIFEREFISFCLCFTKTATYSLFLFIFPSYVVLAVNAEAKEKF